MSSVIVNPDYDRWHGLTMTVGISYGAPMYGAVVRGRPEGVRALRWGRVVEDRLYEDTQAVVSALEVIAVGGNAEAAVPPLGRVRPLRLPLRGASSR
jgi:hypothetical protein